MDIHLLIDEFLNVGFQVRGDGDLSLLADQKFALEVPDGIAGARLVLEELPDLGAAVALDLSQLHHDAGKALLLGEFRNFLVIVKLLPAVLPAGESKNHELAPVLLVEARELCVLAVGQTSFGGNVGGVDDFAFEILHRNGATVTLGGGE